MSGAAEASFVVEPYQFEPILTDLDYEMMIRQIAIMAATTCLRTNLVKCTGERLFLHYIVKRAS